MTRRCRSLLLSRKAIVLLSVAVLGACAAPTQDVAKPEPLPPVAGVASPAGRLVAFCDSVRRYNAGEFARELEQVRQGFVLEKSDWRRLQYSYMLTLPNHKQHDVLRALTLLEPLLRDGRAGEATLWRRWPVCCMHRRRSSKAGRGTGAGEQKTREEQRRADAAEQRATQALIKLDTLRSLEQNLYRRRSKDKY
jgi:hypothetical protein